MDNESNEGHGEIGRRDQKSFTRLIEEKGTEYDPAKLAAIATQMMLRSGDTVDDGPDAEENLFVPAGYTYFGQFVDHDLTLDVTSTLNPEDASQNPDRVPTNLRTPRFDLDCLYGTGPGDRPYMYAADGATLLLGDKSPYPPNGVPPDYDLLRSSNGRAIIGDKRNDENSIVNQIQHAFILFHNKVVRELKGKPLPSGLSLFEAAQQQVRWAYQRILTEDFLPRIINAEVLAALKADVGNNKLENDNGYKLYKKELRTNLPREFVAAAYRYGHSGVRTGYRLNGVPGKNNGTALPIFISGHSANMPAMSLVGFDPLPPEHVIDDWGRFFPTGDALLPGTRRVHNDDMTNVSKGDGGEGKVRMQYAYKIDTTLVDPLADLPPSVADNHEIPVEVRKARGPSLALLNLLRGRVYRLPSGEKVADAIGAVKLEPHEIGVRKTTSKDTVNGFEYVRFADLDTVGNYFDGDTPLWFYVLAEAQAPLMRLWESRGRDKAMLTEEEFLGFDPKDGRAAGICGGTQLGAVGGRIVGEVFYGLLQSDPDSVVNSAPADWHPIWGEGRASVDKLLRYAGLTIAEQPVAEKIEPA
ncbi:peroxidase family protein [Caballeronia mineralivorans]|uniref:peroxidase family protein n=1 Tax=Caballeronia mineralivorans TaxID=2010198 RepID=UPI002AFF5158|nr:peroxidase family protein [Caballeronia mineralivorans]MEA3097232.1 hypothetical protein [Caballeronia mineralivorans]